MTEVAWQAAYAAGRERAEATLAHIPVPPAVASQPGSGSDPYRGVMDSAELQQVINQTRARARELVRVAEVTRPGTSEADSFDREVAARRIWMRAVGRPFSPQELRGVPVLGCAACERMAGLPCDEHERKLGEPIPLPPKPWPSEQPGHYPGAIHLPPYNIENSVK